MKALLIVLSLVTLAACGNKSSDSKPTTERTRDELNNDFVVEVVTNKLPSKVKVSFGDSEFSYEVVNECEEDQSSYVGVTRNATTDQILFAIIDAPMDMTAQITITDLGENCDEDKVVFDELVTPEVFESQDMVTRMFYTLNN